MRCFGTSAPSASSSWSPLRTWKPMRVSGQHTPAEKGKRIKAVHWRVWIYSAGLCSTVWLCPGQAWRERMNVSTHERSLQSSLLEWIQIDCTDWLIVQNRNLFYIIDQCTHFPPPLLPTEYIKMADHYVPVPGGTNNNNYANVELILDIAKRIPVQVFIIDFLKL